MTLFILYQTDIWKSRTSRVYYGIFDSGAKAIDSAKYHGLYTQNSEVVVVRVTLNQFADT